MLNFILFVCFLIIGVLAIYQLAKADILFTFVKEGSAKAILHNGAFHKIIVQYKNCQIDKTTGDVTNGNNKWRKILGKILGGLRWVGIPPFKTLHRYKFRWVTVRPQSGAIIQREEKLDYILVRDDVYGVEVKEAESDGLVPLNITLLLTMCCKNPYKAFFVAQDWSEMVFNRSEATFREYVSGQTFELLVKQKQAAGGELYSKLKDLGLLDRFLNDYGIEIKAVEMKEIKPAGSHAAALEEEASKGWKASKEKERIEMLATAEKQRVLTVTEAELQRIDQVYKKIAEFGDQGTAIRFMESLDKAGEKPGNWIIPFGDIRTAAQSFVGGKGASDIEELLKKEGITYEELRQAIEKMKSLNQAKGGIAP